VSRTEPRLASAGAALLTALEKAHDAFRYLLTPQAVVAPADAAQVAALLRACSEHGAPLTFRSGGTSLSGQAVTGSLLVDTRRHFRAIEILAGGGKVRVQPGGTLRLI
jgi:D-lactate dehydrogenase